MRDVLAAKYLLSDSSSKLAKNKNRQDAARKRVRDPNGKFQGGLIYRRARIIFAIEKVERRAPAAVPTQYETASNSNLCDTKVDFVGSQNVLEDVTLQE